MSKCEHCGTELIDKCYRCGAPVCCPRCCAETEPRRNGERMKLSEILGWRKKDKIHLLFNGRYSQVALETALTSCDREIDREALAEILKECSLCHLAFSHVGECEKQVIELRDLIISTMPKWMKKV